MCTGMCVWTTRAVLNPISYLCKNMYVAQRRALVVSLRVRGVVTMMASLYTLGRHVHNRRTNDEMLLRSHIYIYIYTHKMCQSDWNFLELWVLDLGNELPLTLSQNPRCKSIDRAM